MVLVTGASGHLGRRVVELLVAKGVPVVAATRDPAKLAGLSGVEVRRLDFDDADSLGTAFRGIERALIVSTDRLDVPRSEQHGRAIAAAAKAGVRHLVYTSFANPTETSAVGLARDHRLTEAALVASGVGFTSLRNQLYADLLLQSLPQALASGQWYTARGAGAVAYVTREDCAQAAAGALADGFAGTRYLTISGPEALTGDAIAAIAAEVAGRPLAHVSIPADGLKAGMVGAGLPEGIADLLVSFEVAAARGEMSEVTGHVATLSGRPPISVRAFLQAHAAALRG